MPAQLPAALPLATVRARVPVVLGRSGGASADLVTFHGLVDGREHLACLCPPVSPAPLVRVHSECLTGDLFGSMRCDCGPQLDEAMQILIRDGGVLLYLRQEGRGIGLYNKMDAYLLQDRDVDTFTANQLLGRRADEREYGVAAQMLLALGITEVGMLTNNPEKVRQIRQCGIRVRSVHATTVYLNPHNHRYLRDKAALARHHLRGLGPADRRAVGELG